MPFLCREVCVVYTHLNCPTDTSQVQAVAPRTPFLSPVPRLVLPCLVLAWGVQQMLRVSGTQVTREEGGRTVPHSQKGLQ